MAMFILAPFRRIQIAWKAAESHFWNVKFLYINRLHIILRLLVIKSQGLDNFKNELGHLFLPLEKFSNLHLSREMFL